MGLLGCIFLVLVTDGQIARADTFSVNDVRIDARANIYSAGYSTLGGDGTGIFPPFVSFEAQPASVLSFSSVTGEVGCNWRLTNGPDGTCFPDYGTRILSDNALGRIRVDDLNMFLAGVFLPASGPGTVRPDPLFYDVYPGGMTTHDLTYSPQLNQVFFIGDGLTGTGSGQQQEFYIPKTADRLYLGFADSFDSYPGFYTDNVGKLTAAFSINGTPEPSTMTGCAFALFTAVVVMLGRRRA